MIFRALTFAAIVSASTGPTGAGEPFALRGPPQPTGQSGAPAVDAAHLRAAEELIDGGIRYLLSRADDNGSWSIAGANRPALTAMVLKALVQHPDFDSRRLRVRKAFDVMLSYRQGDGGIYDPKTGLANYTTAIAVMAMVAADDRRFDDATRRAVAFLKGQQIVPGSASPDGSAID